MDIDINESTIIAVAWQYSKQLELPINHHNKIYLLLVRDQYLINLGLRLCIVRKNHLAPLFCTIHALVIPRTSE